MKNVQDIQKQKMELIILWREDLDISRSRFTENVDCVEQKSKFTRSQPEVGHEYQLRRIFCVCLHSRWQR